MPRKGCRTRPEARVPEPDLAVLAAGRERGSIGCERKGANHPLVPFQARSKRSGLQVPNQDTSWSAPPEASRLSSPPGANATARTEAECPASVAVSRPVATSQIRTVLS